MTVKEEVRVSDSTNERKSPSNHQDIPACARHNEHGPRPAPIIIYPEFLIRSEKSSLATTIKTLFYILRIFSGTAIITTLLIQHWIRPWIQAGIQARRHHILLWREQLSSLIAKLSSFGNNEHHQRNYDDLTLDDEDQSMSDGGKQFTRNIATQTDFSSLPSLHRASASTSSVSEQLESPFCQVELLEKTSAALSEAKTLAYGERDLDEELRHLVKDLECLSSPNPMSYSTTLNKRRGSNAAPDTAGKIHKLRHEIRTMKGYLLSADSF